MDDSDFDKAVDQAVQTAQEAGMSDVLDEVPLAGDIPENPEIVRLRARLEELEPFEEMLKAIGRGEVVVSEPAPPGPPIPDPEDVALYHKNVTENPYILDQVKRYAESLPPEEKERLDNDYRFFNQTFARFRAANQPAPAESPRIPKRDLEAVLAAKESKKDAARAERAGCHPRNAHGPVPMEADRRH